MDANTTNIIEKLGGSGEVAKLCEVTVGAVSQWKTSGKIPKPRAMYLRAIRPDVFAEAQRPTPKEAA